MQIKPTPMDANENGYLPIGMDVSVKFNLLEVTSQISDSLSSDSLSRAKRKLYICL